MRFKFLLFFCNTTMNSSESSVHRKRGNELYIASQNNNFGNSMKKIKLENALRCYNKALACASYCDDKASALKDIAVTTYKLFELCKAESKVNVKELMYFSKTSLKNYDLAYSYCDYKHPQWGTQLLETINSLVQEMIDFHNLEKQFDEAMRTLENCAFSLRYLTSLKAEMLLVVVRSRFGNACGYLNEKKFQGSLNQLSECSRPLEEAIKLNILNENDLLTLRKDILHNKCVSESLQAIHVGDEMLTKYINSDENLDMEMVWFVIDKYKEAILLSHEKDVEVEAIALSRLGRITKKILLNREKAKEYYHRSLQLAFSLIPRTFERDAWFQEAKNALEELQSAQLAAEEERKRKLREPYMKEVLADIKRINDITSFEGFHAKLYKMIIFTYETFPPKHKDFKKPDNIDKTASNFKPNLKKLLKKIIIDYHPDKVDEKVFGFRHKIFCEEISKVFNNYHCMIKEIDSS